MKTIITVILSIFWCVSALANMPKEKIAMVFQIEWPVYNLSDLKAQQKKLTKKGFSCKIVYKTSRDYLWCNEVHTLSQMQKIAAWLKMQDIPFTLVDLREKEKKDHKRFDIPLMIFGYRALERGDFKKAADIFKAHYNRRKSPESAYAYALALMKMGSYQKALAILASYQQTDKKCQKLYQDIAAGYFYNAIRRHQYKKAHAIVRDYFANNQSMHQKVTLAKAQVFAKQNRFDKAAELISKIDDPKTKVKIAKLVAGRLMQKKMYDQAIALLKPYTASKSVRRMLKDAAIGSMYAAIKSGDFKKAHQIAKAYLSDQRRYHREIDRKWIAAMAPNNKEELEALIKRSPYLTPEDIKKIHYEQALALMQKKAYRHANALLAPYYRDDAKVRSLYLANIMAEAGQLNEQGKVDEALSLLRPYRTYPKIRQLYESLYLGNEMAEGWMLLEHDPAWALRLFQESCRIKESEDCLSGEMYAYGKIGQNIQAYRLAELLYERFRKDEYALAAYQYALAMKRYDLASDYYKIAKRLDTRIQEPNFLRLLDQIDRLIKHKSYRRAEALLRQARTHYGDDREILRRYIALMIDQKAYTKAALYAQALLQKEPDDIDGRYALARYAGHIDHNYEACRRLLEPVALKRDYVKEFYHECRVREWIQEKAFDEAKRELEYIDNHRLRAALALTIAQHYEKSGQLKEALAWTKRAYEENANDFGIVQAYLYRLKQADDLSVFAKVYQEARSRFVDRQDQLKAIERAYLKERLGRLFTQKRYEECTLFAQKLLRYYKDEEFLETGAWCAYNAHAYKVAMQYFARLNHNYREDTKWIYAFAISAYKAGFKELAWRALNRIRTIRDEKDAYAIAALYAQLHDSEMAKAILKQLPESSEKERALTIYNDRYKEPADDAGALSVGYYYQTRTGKEGKGRLKIHSVPITWHYQWNRDTHFVAKADTLLLDTGRLQDRFGFGLNDTLPAHDRTRAAAFYPEVGVAWKQLYAKVGTTPIGDLITPTPTWLVGGKMIFGAWQLYLQAQKQSLAESFLSFVGDEVYKGNSQSRWGRVTKEGYEGGIGYSDVVRGSLEVGYYPKIKGHHVQENSETKTTLSLWYAPPIEHVSVFDIGLVGVYDHFDKNTLAFTYGHGGYFSPSQFWLGMLMMRLADRWGKFYFRTEGGVGLESYKNDDTVEFPLFPTIKGLPIVGHDDEGVTYQWRIDLGYSFSDRWDLVATYGMEKMYDYKMNSLGAAFVYRYDDLRLSPFATFGLNHRMDKVFK